VGQGRKLRSVFAILLLQVDVVASGLGVGVFGLPGSVAVEFALALVIGVVGGNVDGRAKVGKRSVSGGCCNGVALRSVAVPCALVATSGAVAVAISIAEAIEK
jgi:hypothetical protein